MYQTRTELILSSEFIYFGLVSSVSSTLIILYTDDVSTISFFEVPLSEPPLPPSKRRHKIDTPASFTKCCIFKRNAFFSV